jgi:hypothetical protein
MPEELAIGLIVVFAVGWIFVKVFQVLATAVGDIQKAIDDASIRRQRERTLAGRARLSPFVRIILLFW